MPKRIVVTVLKYGLGLGLLAWVIGSNWHRTTASGEEVGLARALEGPVHVGPLALAAGICLAGVLLTFVRWYLLVRAQGLPFTLPAAFRLGLVGLFFNTFLPGSVGGDIIKAAALAREQSRRTVAVATVLLDRAIGLVGLVWLAALLGGIFWSTGVLGSLAHSEDALAILEAILLGTWVLVGASLLFWVTLGLLPTPWADGLAARLERFPKVGTSLAELWRAVWMYRCRGRSVAAALMLAMVGHAAFILTFYLAARTLSSADRIPSFEAHVLLVPVGMTIRAGFPAPGGVGGAEYGFGWLYQSLGAGFALGVLALLVQRVIEWTLGLGAYLVYLRMRPRLQTPAEPAQELVSAQV